MGDLFSTTEPAKPKKKIFYKGKGGKFSDKETARITAIEAENARLKVSNEYHKRQAERLAGDYREEHAKVLELQAELKRYTTHQILYEQTNLQPTSTSSVN
jgi:hypothetical protein